MKQPEGHDYTDYDTCVVCDVDWPCPPWQKWTQSKAYRLQEAERKIASLEQERARNAKTITEHRDRLHRLEVLVKGAWPALIDLLGGRPGGSLTVGENVDYQDFHTYQEHIRVAGLREFYCTYSSPDGTEWRNGETTERIYRKP